MQDWTTSAPDTAYTKIAQDLFGCWSPEEYARQNREAALTKIIESLRTALRPQGSNFVGKQYAEFVERYCADESNKYAELVSPEFSQCLYLVSQILYLGFVTGFYTVFKKADEMVPYTYLYEYPSQSAGCFLNSYDSECGIGIAYKGACVEIQIGMLIYDLPNGVVQSVYQLSSVSPILNTSSIHSTLIQWNENDTNVWVSPDSSVNSFKSLYKYLTQLEGVD